MFCAGQDSTSITTAPVKKTSCYSSNQPLIRGQINILKTGTAAALIINQTDPDHMGYQGGSPCATKQTDVHNAWPKCATTSGNQDLPNWLSQARSPQTKLGQATQHRRTTRRNQTQQTALHSLLFPQFPTCLFVRQPHPVNKVQITSAQHQQANTRKKNPREK